MAGTQIQIGATVTNFLGINGTNTSMWTTFSSKKQMYLIDLQDIYTFKPAVDNTLSPRVRIPYC